MENEPPYFSWIRGCIGSGSPPSDGPSDTMDSIDGAHFPDVIDDGIDFLQIRLQCRQRAGLSRVARCRHNLPAKLHLIARSPVTRVIRHRTWRNVITRVLHGKRIEAGLSQVLRIRETSAV